MFRQFSTGATRDTASGKLEYSRFINPLNDFSFASYMQSKQIIGWEYRRWDNRQKGIPEESLFDSLCRHIECLKLLKAWNTVDEIDQWWWIVWRVWNDGHYLWSVLKEWNNKIVFDEKIMKPKNIIDELNAIRFNGEAMKLQYLTLEIIDEQTRAGNES